MKASFTTPSTTIVGIISDTHGYLSASAINALTHVDRIIHAGDIGKPEILETLRRIAPVAAVRGNMDSGEWARSIPKTEVVDIGDVLIYVIHDIHELDTDLSSTSIRAVVSGHLHCPSVFHHNGVLYVNPGSPTLPRRSAASIGRIEIRGDTLDGYIVALV